jgi:hypothetical protein
VGVSPLQLVNLHRNRRYFVIKLHTWFCLSYFLKTNIHFFLHLSIFDEYQQFFQHRICFSIQPPDYSDPWPRLARSSSFFLLMLFKYYCLWSDRRHTVTGETIITHFMFIGSTWMHTLHKLNWLLARVVKLLNNFWTGTNMYLKIWN